MGPGSTVRSAFRFLLLVIGSVAASAASPAFAAQPDGHVVKVTVTSSRVSLTARETPLDDVLAAIGRRSGVKMVLRGDLNSLVTETLVNVPLDDAIQRLSRWHSVVLICDGAPSEAGGTTLSEVWVTRSSPVDGGTDPDRNKRPAEGVQRHDGRVADAREGSAVMGRSRVIVELERFSGHLLPSGSLKR